MVVLVGVGVVIVVAVIVKNQTPKKFKFPKSKRSKVAYFDFRKLKITKADRKNNFFTKTKKRTNRKTNQKNLFRLPKTKKRTGARKTLFQFQKKTKIVH